MIADLFADLFSLISEIDCWDMDDPNCMEGVLLVLGFISNALYGLTGTITLLFLLLAALPRYTFRWSFLNDIILRRVIFLAGLGLTAYMIFAAWDSALTLCSLREDSDMATEVFAARANQARIIALCIYPVTFLVVSLALDKLLRRRKLMTIFRSNNKVFGLI